MKTLSQAIQDGLNEYTERAINGATKDDAAKIIAKHILRFLNDAREKTVIESGYHQVEIAALHNFFKVVENGPTNSK